MPDYPSFHKNLFLSQGVFFALLSLQMQLAPGATVESLAAEEAKPSLLRSGAMLDALRGWGASLIAPALLNLYAYRNPKYAHLASLATYVHEAAHLVIHISACRKGSDWNSKAMRVLAALDVTLLVANVVVNRQLKAAAH